MAESRLGGIPERVAALRAGSSWRDARHREVLAVRRGDIETIAPDLLSDQFPRSIVANLIDTTARDVAAVLAPLPSFSCNSTSMTSDRAKAFADKRGRIVRHYIESSELQQQMLDGADDFNSFGLIVTRVKPDFETETPYIKMESAVGAYPVWDDRGRTVEFARVYRRSWFSILADYPHLEAKRHEIRGANLSDQVEVVHYESNTRILVYVPSLGDLVLEDMPNPMGRCMVQATLRPMSQGEARGAYDDVIWVQFARHRLQALLIEGVDKAVRAPIGMPDDANDFALGPDSIIRTRNPQAISRVRLDVPTQAFGAVEQLKQEQQLGAMSPEARSGSVDASIITGRGVQQLMAGFSTQIAAGQTSLRYHLKRVVELCFLMDEKLFGDVEKDVRGNDKGIPYSVRYKPSRDIDGDHTVDITYGFAAGMDPNRALVFLLQAQGAGVISRDYLARNLPVDINPVDEARKIQVEQSRDALIQAFSALTQSIPQLVAAGQDATSVVMAQAKLVKLIQEGKSVEEAVLEALKPPEPPPGTPDAGNGAESPSGNPMDAASGFGPEGLPSGLNLNQATQGPGARPPLSMLLASMGTNGQPNLQAGVSRQVPLAGGR